MIKIFAVKIIKSFTIQQGIIDITNGFSTPLKPIAIKFDLDILLQVFFKILLSFSRSIIMLPCYAIRIIFSYINYIVLIKHYVLFV